MTTRGKWSVRNATAWRSRVARLRAPDRLCKIDPDLLSANKRIINMGLELMGARTLQRMAVENDVRGHNTAAASGFRESVREIGLRETLRNRDAKFGDGRARVNGPEFRDETGRLRED